MTRAGDQITRRFGMVEATIDLGAGAVLLKRSSVGPEPGAPKGAFRARLHSLDEIETTHGHHAARSGRWSVSMCAALRWAAEMLNQRGARADTSDAGERAGS